MTLKVHLLNIYKEYVSLNTIIFLDSLKSRWVIQSGNYSFRPSNFVKAHVCGPFYLAQSSESSVLFVFLQGYDK